MFLCLLILEKPNLLPLGLGLWWSFDCCWTNLPAVITSVPPSSCTSFSSEVELVEGTSEIKKMILFLTIIGRKILEILKIFKKSYKLPDVRSFLDGGAFSQADPVSFSAICLWKGLEFLVYSVAIVGCFHPFFCISWFSVAPSFTNWVVAVARKQCPKIYTKVWSFHIETKNISFIGWNY